MYKTDQTIKRLVKHIYYTLTIILLFSCGNEKVLQLPEIDHSEITEILDVSPAYLFYDVTKADSIELNRKNLIGSTNWLVNIDKRLNLRQAIPSIVFIQNKKRDAQMHKNENAKNYFTCHDKSINNLGFIDFTDIYYHEEKLEDYLRTQNITEYHVLSFNKDSITLNNRSVILKELQQFDSSEAKVFLRFDKQLSFQNYISYKEQLLKLNSTQINIDNDEFIY